MSAEEYNRIRRILFSTVNDPQKGFSTAYEWLEKTYRRTLGAKGHAGLMAELKFYESYRKEYKLTIAGDMGEHADFSGEYDRNQTRFDVTTNLTYKQFKDYEPFVGDGIKYKIAFYDKKNFEIVDILELAFPKCNCGGFLIPFILLKGQNYNNHGEPRWTNDQILMEICTNCSEFKEKDRWSHHFLYSPSEFSKFLPEDMDNEDVKKEIENYNTIHYKYFRREYCDNLMAIAEPIYKVTGRKGEGYWTFEFGFINRAAEGEILLDIDTGQIM